MNAFFSLPVVTQPVKTTTQLSPGGIFTSAWFDGSDCNTLLVSVEVVSASPSASLGALIRESDDSTIASLARTVIAQTASSFPFVMVGIIRRRFWQVAYTTAGSTGSGFVLCANSFTQAPPTLDSSGNAVVVFPANTIIRVNGGGLLTTSVPGTSSSGPMQISTAPGLLSRIVVTKQPGSSPVDMRFVDTASGGSGTIIGYVPGTAALGTVYTLDMPVANGISAQWSDGNAVDATVSYY